MLFSDSWLRKNKLKTNSTNEVPQLQTLHLQTVTWKAFSQCTSNSSANCKDCCNKQCWLRTNYGTLQSALLHTLLSKPHLLAFFLHHIDDSSHQSSAVFQTLVPQMAIGSPNFHQILDLISTTSLTKGVLWSNNTRQQLLMRSNGS